MNPSSRNRASQNAGPGAGEAHPVNPTDKESGFRLYRIKAGALNAGEKVVDGVRAICRLLNLWGDQRSLIGEILALQMMFALVLSAAAIGFLWWTSGWVVEDNLQN